MSRYQLRLPVGEAVGIDTDYGHLAAPQLTDQEIGRDVELVGEDQDRRGSETLLVLAGLAIGLLGRRGTLGVDRGGLAGDL